MPFTFSHCPSSDNPFIDNSVHYNDVYGAGTVSYAVNDFSKFYGILCKQAPRYDKIYIPMLNGWQNYNIWSQSQIDLYDQLVGGQLYPAADPNYNSSSDWRDLSKKNIYEQGMRFVKFRVPKYTWSQPFYHRPDATLARYDYMVTNYDITKEQTAIQTNIELDAKMCVAATWEYSSQHRQNPIYCAQALQVAQKLIDNTVFRPSSIHSGRAIVIGSADGGYSIYDREQAGEAYAESIQFSSYNEPTELYPHGDPSEPLQQYYMRVYAFILDGEYYVDQRVHVYDPVTMEELTDMEVYIDYFEYPSRIYGICNIGSMTQPEDTEPFYPSWWTPLLPSNSLADGTTFIWGNMSGWNPSTDPLPIYNTCWRGKAMAPGAVYGTDYPYEYRTDFQSYLVMDELSEEEFWQAEARWHTLNGGTPYTPPTSIPSP